MKRVCNYHEKEDPTGFGNSWEFGNKSGKRGIGGKSSKSISFRAKQKKNINKNKEDPTGIEWKDINRWE